MKKVLVIIATIIVSIALIVSLITCIPQHTKITQTLNAIQLDKDGNIIGTEEIAMQGIFRDYRFKEDTIELHIAPFGMLKSISFSGDSRWDSQSELTDLFGEFYEITFGAWNTSKDDYDFGTIIVSKDFEYWFFRADDNGQPIYYVASASGEHTVEEIVQYFKGLAPGYVPGTKTAKSS